MTEPRCSRNGSDLSTYSSSSLPLGEAKLPYEQPIAVPTGSKVGGQPESALPGDAQQLDWFG